MTALTQVKLQTMLTSATQLALPDLQLVAQKIQTKTCAAGEAVFQQGTEHPYVYGIMTGLGITPVGLNRIIQRLKR